MNERPAHPAPEGEEAFDGNAAPTAHLQLLCLIEQPPEYSQRRLAPAMGMSLGKTHYLPRARFDKGLVKAGKFGSSVEKLSFLYRLTPSGVKHSVAMTRRFLSKKEQELELLWAEIERLAGRAGCGRNPSTDEGSES